MRFPKSALLLMLCSSLALPAAASQVGQPVPLIHATLLTGAAVSLPQDLHGAPAVLVIGFSQGSRPQVADWGKRLTAEYGGANQVKWFEVAELESVPRLLRGWVVKKVKESVSTRGQQTFLVITDHEREWKQVVGFDAPDAAYVVVVNGRGVAQAVAQGAVKDASFQQVKAAVEMARLGQ